MKYFEASTLKPITMPFKLLPFSGAAGGGSSNRTDISALQKMRHFSPMRVFCAYFALTLCLLASCKKNNGTNGNGDPNKLKMYIETEETAGTTLTDTFDVSYDNNNRITGLTSPQVKFVYAYQSKSATLDLYEYSQLSIHEIFYINGAFVVDSTLQYNDTNDTTTEGYDYNGNLLTTMFTYNYSTYGTTIYSRDDYTYDNNGNLLKDTQSDGYGDVSTISSFTYTTHAVNVTINPTYQPLQAKYLPATETITDGNGSLLHTLTYTYTFDGSGRLTKETETADNGEIGTKTYVYE